ncbi:hypothetical protein GCM10012275_32520 [Longimycelium tulufanense]|uniref:Uncharacterized protein n=1 Tax=Longimycelium tulufanense TaxID=907463 RepID=A0A8J3FUY0_9PSEU|nr:hypothetical protein GCM10012275_32520 [Longimycelium tulufanense]
MCERSQEREHRDHRRQEVQHGSSLPVPAAGQGRVNPETSLIFGTTPGRVLDRVDR